MIELRTRKNIVSCVFCRYKTLFVHVTIEIHLIRDTDKDTLYFDIEEITKLGRFPIEIKQKLDC